MSETPVLNAEQVAERLRTSDIVLVDVRPPQLYARGHVPGAVNLPTFLLGGSQGDMPAAEGLVRSFGKLGISADRYIVAYDDGASPAAARLFWVLSYYRHARVSVLDGGIRAWTSRGYPLESGAREVDAVEYSIGEPDTSLSVSTDDLLKSLDDDELLLLDVRAIAEYQGLQTTAARNGHIPNAVHIEWRESLEAGENGIQLRPRADLERTFVGAGVTSDRRIVVYCQSGQRASHAFLTLKHLGYPHVAQYGAGWQEWGNRPDTPVDPE
jgi:thiosulfate/3-mercaptopyruvate sulfurtransferase